MQCSGWPPNVVCSTFFHAVLTLILEGVSNVNTTVEALFELQEDMLAPAVLQLRNDLQLLSTNCTQTCELLPSSSTIDIEADWSDVS